MKTKMNKLILYLTRKGYTYDRIRKTQLKLLIVFVFLLLIFGLNWSVILGNPVIKISATINNIIWWSLIIIQNFSTFVFFKFLKRMLLFRNEYKKQLLTFEHVMVGFNDDKFEVGKIYKVCNIDNLHSIKLNENYFLGDMLFENGKDYNFIEGDKIFKFISPKENRKLKLEKLKRI